MITEVVKENVDGIKEFMKLAEVRHLPKMNGAFVIADKTDYEGSPETENGTKAKVCSNDA